MGNKIEIGDYDSDAKLQKIAADPSKFKISIILGLIEHFSIIILAIMLFISFNSYNLILAVIWTIFRIVEGSVFSYIEINFRGILNIAKQYSLASGAEKKFMSDLGRKIFQTKFSRFTFGMVFYSIGTLAYSILFVTYGLVPIIIGWLGIIASITSGVGNGIQIVKPKFEVLGAIGGILTLIFEVILGGWLLFVAL